jgi:aminotransferase
MNPYLANRVTSLKPSGIRKFFEIAATMEEVISLGIGEPDFITPRSILQAGVTALNQGHTHYTPFPGLMELRVALGEHLHSLYGVSYDPKDEILVTVGVSEALYLALSVLLNPGEEIVIHTPCFVSYKPEIIIAGGVPVDVPCQVNDGFQPRAETLRSKITPKTKAILLSYPNNPTGAVASRETLLKVARIAEANNLLVISDEIYDQLVYGVEHVCFASLPGMRERTITLGGLSKNYAMTGWRIGYAAAPAEITRAMLRIHQYSITSAPTISQFAGLEAIQHGYDHVVEMRNEYDRRRKLILSGLNQLGLTTFEPRGAFYAFPQIDSSGMDDETFAERLLMEERVVVIPGNAFGEAGTGFIRCSYATAYDKIEEALERMARFLQRHR